MVTAMGCPAKSFAVNRAPIPTTTSETDAWRFTNVRSVLALNFRQSLGPFELTLKRKRLACLANGKQHGMRLVVLKRLP